jgi:dCTP deaminase
MYLSDRELKKALQNGQLIIQPEPKRIDPTSIDLHLAAVDEARIWDIDAYESSNRVDGKEARELRISQIDYKKFSMKYQIQPPHAPKPNDLVFRRDRQLVIRPRGFVLWQTREIVGTTELKPKFICFINGKSTRARTGIMVHLTAPTIHAGWTGNVTLEIANLGPFDLVLQEFEDVIAQLTVAKITSSPKGSMRGSATFGQLSVDSESGSA